MLNKATGVGLKTEGARADPRSSKEWADYGGETLSLQQGPGAEPLVEVARVEKPPEVEIFLYTFVQNRDGQLIYSKFCQVSVVHVYQYKSVLWLMRAGVRQPALLISGFLVSTLH